MIAARIRVAVGFGVGVAVGVTSGFFSSADMGSYPNVLFGVFCDFFYKSIDQYRLLARLIASSISYIFVSL